MLNGPGPGEGFWGGKSGSSIWESALSVNTLGKCVTVCRLVGLSAFNLKCVFPKGDVQA